MKCQNCGDDLPSNPEMDIEDGRLGQVVKHVYDPSDDPFAVSETAMYCDPECAVEAWQERDVA